MIALVRAVSPALGNCELTHVTRQPIDPVRASAQHEGYVAVLRELGARIEYLPPLPGLPDGVFVEDTAVVLDEIAIMARPGARSRQHETATVAEALGRHRATAELVGDERLEGGDVLRIGRTLYVGQSTRTNASGLARLRELTQPWGYEVRPVVVQGCLHLKTACTFIPPHWIVANPAWVEVGEFRDVTVLLVSRGEPFAGNTLTLGAVTLVSAGAPQTERILAAAGVVTRRLDVSELHKAEAGLTCLSLLFKGD
jgi:dimethylargininase